MINSLRSQEMEKKRFFGKCFNCGKKCHRQSEYKKEVNINNDIVVENQHEEISADKCMYSNFTSDFSVILYFCVDD